MKGAWALGGLLLVGSMAPAQTETGWKTLVSREGHFSIRMPAPVEEAYAPSQEEGGTVRQYFYKASLPDGHEYVVSCWDYTDAPRRQLDARELDDAVAAQRESLRRVSSSVRKLRLGHVPGRELRIVRADGRTDLFRLYLTGRRLYSLSKVVNGRPDQPEASRTFLDSFRLLP